MNFPNLLTRAKGFFAKDAAFTNGVQLRPNDGQGPFTPYFQSFIPRNVEASFYEFLREAIPIVDAAIGRLVSLDGHIVVKGNNDKLVDIINDWKDNVAVNDLQTGLQAFHANVSNEAFEQGFGLGEFITDKARRDIIGLRVADSKFIKFRRQSPAGGIDILQKASADLDWRLLKRDNLMYFSIGNENQNPHGTPMLRSCEFVAKVLATMHNSLLNVWERFGDPSYSVTYKTSKRDGADHKTRRDQMATEFDAAVRAKRAGKSADFIRAIDKDSDIDIKIIGADGQVLEMEVPSRHVLEQIVSKTGLPPWMLGLHWSTTERLANFEVEMVLADVVTRQAAKLPSFTRLVQTMLLLRGYTWKKGDWWLEFEQVNLHDVVAQAQARFLNAQADMYHVQNAETLGIALDVRDLSIGKALAVHGEKSFKLPGETVKAAKSCGCKEGRRAEEWPEVDSLEEEYEKRLQGDWADLLARVKTILGLDQARGAKEEGDPPGFSMSAEQRGLIDAELKTWLAAYNPASKESPVYWFYGQAFSAGVIRAARMVEDEVTLLSILKNHGIFDKLVKDGFDLVKDNATKALRNKILPEMEAHVIAGSNPVEVARRLEKLFTDKNADWQRLARSEMAMAAESAKHAEWKERGLKRLDFAPAPDACDMCRSLAGEYDIDKCPLPVRDTHPRCRCSSRPAKSEA
ncbi:MAG: hypothetical protein OEV73_00170 [Desulfobulbaceae bacterium]|nr:hypothetical protein [Desulfobulbaceae bacterium]